MGLTGLVKRSMHFIVCCLNLCIPLARGDLLGISWLGILILLAHNTTKYSIFRCICTEYF